MQTSNVGLRTVGRLARPVGLIRLFGLSVYLVEQEKLNDARHTRQRSFGMQNQFSRSLIECTIAGNPLRFLRILPVAHGHVRAFRHDHSNLSASHLSFLFIQTTKLRAV